MIPKIASALARVLDPIKPIDRPNQTRSLAKSSEGGEGGYGPNGYEKPADEDPSHRDSDTDPPGETPLPHLSASESGKRPATLPLQPGLTQVILELNGSRAAYGAGAAALSYETGAKDQKKNARLPKGSMLDKKVG
ncbi:MAG: hypothetical protein JST04_14850 [Bdellovibrionales bacterium]|nr:hypothetical protein [Bdellovibrionales bacterium]